MDNKTKKLITEDQPTTKYESIKGGRNSFRQKSNSFGMNISIDEEDQVSAKACCFWCTQRYFTIDKLKRRFPIIKWLPKYTTKDFKGDLIAGISVGMTIIPQSLAFALLAGLPPQYGLYSSFLGPFIYAIFGTCRDAALGPTSILSILTAPYALLGGPIYANLLCFISGIVMLIFGLLNFGFIVDFVSFPVLSAFSTAAAITIIISQLKSFFGLAYPSGRLLDNLINFLNNLHQIRISDMILGIVCLLFLIPLQSFKDKRFLRKKSKQSKVRKLVNSSWFVIVTGRNALIVLATAVVTYYLIFHQVTTTKEIKPGLPGFHLPKFTYHNWDEKTNQTVDKKFDVVFKEIGGGIPVIVLISILETVAVDKAFQSSAQLVQSEGHQNSMLNYFTPHKENGSFVIIDGGQAICKVKVIDIITKKEKECGNLYANDSSWRKHYKEAHLTVAKVVGNRVSCEHCGTISNASSIKRHQIKHLKEELMLKVAAMAKENLIRKFEQRLNKISEQNDESMDTDEETLVDDDESLVINEGSLVTDDESMDTDEETLVDDEDIIVLD